MTDLAKFIAERINGGTWEDPQYYADEQRALWEEHAKVIKSVFWFFPFPAGTPKLRPMDEAPKDRPILVRFDHDADPYHIGEGRLTLYGAHAEGLSCRAGKGWCIAVWGGGKDFDEDEGGGYLPDWWFQEGSEFEVAVNPVGWVNIDLEEK